MVKYVSIRSLKEGAYPAEYEKFYRTEHVPLAKTIPGVKKVTIALVCDWGNQKAPYYRMTEIYFDNMEALQKGMSSPEAQMLGSQKPLLEMTAEGGIKFLAEEEQVYP
jgi:uncharacterized protein (TIGR02118 family)